MTDIAPIATRPPDLARLHDSSSPTIPTKINSRSNSLTTQPTTTSQSHLSALQRDGFVVVPNLLPPHLLLATQATAKYLVQRVRSGTFWPYVRTVGKQYPPWPVLDLKAPDGNLNVWGVQHLLHPELRGLRDVFAEVYFCEAVLGVVRELLAEPGGEEGARVGEGELVMELFNMLVSPTRGEDFELEWHRDDVRPEVSGEEEQRLLVEKAPGGRQLHAQYNIALFGDESLIVVPGSHRRLRTQQEREAGKYDVLPREVRVKLNPGDAVFYDSNILHRGVYKGIDESKELGEDDIAWECGFGGVWGGEE